MFQPARPSDRWSSVANCRATSKGSLNVVLMVPVRPRRSVTAASAPSTVKVSGRPTTSRSWMRPRCSRSRRPSARKKKSNRPRSAVRARCTNESNSIWLPDSGSDHTVVLLTPGKVRGEVNRLAVLAFSTRSSDAPALGDQLVGAQPVGVPVRDGGDDEFVGVRDALQRLQLLGDLIGVTDELRCGAVLHHARAARRSAVRRCRDPGRERRRRPARIEYTQWP